MAEDLVPDPKKAQGTHRQQTGRVKIKLHAGQARIWESKARFPSMIAGSGGGKALALDTLVPTPQGWATIGTIERGDHVFDGDGGITTVMAVTEVMRDRPCYRVILDDHTEIVADAEHLWLTASRSRAECGLGKSDTVVTTRHMSETLRHHGHDNHTIRGVVVPGHNEKHVRDRHVKSVTQIVSVPVRCIQVAHRAGSFLITNTYVRTHNSWLGPRWLIREMGWCGANEGDNYLAVGPTWRMVRRIIVPGIVEHLKEIGQFLQYKRTDGEIHLKCGAQIFLGSAVDPLSIEGVHCFLPGTMVGAYQPTPIESVMDTVIGHDGKSHRVLEVMERSYEGEILTITATGNTPLEVTPNHPILIIRPAQGVLQRAQELLSGGWKAMWVCASGILPGDLLLSPVFEQVSEERRAIAIAEVVDLGNRARTWSAWHSAVSHGHHPIMVDDGVDFYAGKERGAVRWKDYYCMPVTSITSRDYTGPVYNLSVEGAHTYLANGAVVHNCKGGWGDEPGQWSLEAWEVCQRRVGFNRGRFLLTTTPYSENWLRTEVLDRFTAGDPDYDVVNFPSYWNPNYDIQEYLRAKRTLPKWRFEMFYNGKITRPEGLVYETPLDELLVDTLPEGHESWHWGIGLDLGWNNATSAIIGVMSPDGVLYICGEHYAREASLDQHAHALSVWKEIRPQRMLGVFYDPQAAQIVDELSRKPNISGWPWTPANNAVLAGILEVQARAKTGKLKFVKDSCPHLCDEWGMYRWAKRTRDGERSFDPLTGEVIEVTDAPIKSNDHCLAAGTMVQTIGGEVPIEDVRVGDQVATRQGWKRVTDSWQVSPSTAVSRLRCSDGTEIVGTGNHKIWVVDRGWVEMDDLRGGDRLVPWQILNVVVGTVTPELESRAVYDLSVADAHEFYANGVLVHNSADALRYLCSGLRTVARPGIRVID